MSPRKPATPSQDLALQLQLDGYEPRLSPIQSRIIDAAAYAAEGQPDTIDFLHAVLCQVGLPRRRTVGDRFERTSGTASLLVKAGELWNDRAKKWEAQPLPYGTKPRLALIHICSEAVRTKSPRVEMGDSVRDFLMRLGLDTGGHEYARFRSQMRALAACSMTVGIGPSTVRAEPIKEFSAWLDTSGAQRTMWPGEIELTTDFFSSLVAHAVPVDPRALGALKHSALAMDVYVWLAHRLCRVTSAAGSRLSWANLRDQFGQEYKDPKDFKKEFRPALAAALAVYPDAKVETITGGLVLKPSPTPIRRTLVTVQKSGEK